MRARWLVPATFVLALSVPGLAGDGDKPAEPGKPAAPEKTAPPKEKAPAAKDSRDAKDAEKKPAGEPVVAAAVLVRPAPKDLDEAMRRLAKVKVNVNFADVAFADAVDYIHRVAGFNVIVSPVLQMKGVDGIRPITLALREVSLKQVAELLAQFSGTKLKLADGILQFTTPEDARGKPVLHIYLIGDVTMRLHNFPGPDLNLRPAKQEFEPEPESDVPNFWSDPQKVIEMIQKTCAEETWSDKDVSISADENKLIVKQYPEVQKQIARIIALLRAAR
jgi:hypothetical protein